jgi:hypothetical protein
MNSVQMAPLSTVAVLIRSTDHYILRCVDCDWGLTLADWQVALAEATAHEREHGKGFAPRGRVPA